MNKYLRDIYEGIYFYSSDYEYTEFHGWTMKSRFMVIFYLYYISVAIVLLGIKVYLYGAFKPSIVSALLYTFGLFFLLYYILIYPNLNLDDIDEDMNNISKKEKVRKSKFLFFGGVASLVISFIILNFLYEK